jgi:hypothetical protein
MIRPRTVWTLFTAEKMRRITAAGTAVKMTNTEYGNTTGKRILEIFL